MTYQEYIKKDAKFKEAITTAEKNVMKISDASNGGLLSDKILKSEEYISAKATFQKLFNAYRDFNSTIPKKFKIRKSKEYRDSKWKN